VTLQAAGGFAAHLFPTGKGHVSGRPIELVIESPANPRTARVMPQHIDVDVSDLLRREMTIDEAGERLITRTLRLWNGRMTWPRR
jgi:(2R)-sulfolactate sulfo-lyase subunit beta